MCASTGVKRKGGKLNRSSQTSAVVLRNTRIGEIHKGVTLLTPDDGLLRAIAHGAYSQKGKLRGTTNLFCYGTCYLYTDRARDSVKITDFDVHDYFSPIREDIVRFYTASLWAEAIIKTYAGGGESNELFTLFIHALNQIQHRAPEEAERVSVQFVWRFLGLSGMRPDLEICAASGDYLSENEPIYYSSRDQGFCAPEHASDEMPAWQPGAAAYLRHTGNLEFQEALRPLPPPGALARIKRVLYSVLQEHVETPINSLRSGSGIL